MRRERTWPSRRLQLIVIALLILGVGLRVFWQPIAPKPRAHKLYLDSWFARTRLITGLGDMRHESDAAVRMLDRALKLDPGNPLYEEALVWQYQRSKLPDLLRERKLGPGARRLAAGLFQSSKSYEDKDRLASLTELENADPTNSLVRYRRAYALIGGGRTDEALREMKAAGKLGPLRFYYPRVPAEVAETVGAPLVGMVLSTPMAELRRLTQACVDLANDRLRHGKVQEASDILDSCRRMAVNTAASEPPTYIGFLVAKAIYEITMAELRPTTYDFGTKDEIAAMERLDDAFQRAYWECKDDIPLATWPRDMILPLAIPGAVALASAASLTVLLLSALIWPLPALIRRRRAHPAEAAAPWGHGFLARLFLTTWLPLIIAFVPATYFAVGYLGDTPVSAFLEPFPIIAISLVQLIVIGFILRVLHHRHDEATGEPTGMLRFLFRAPASAKAWTRKYIVVGMLGQLVFLACCLLLATIVYKPIFGGHPWETTRFRLHYVAREYQVSKHIASEITRASLALDGKQKQGTTRMRRM